MWKLMKDYGTISVELDGDVAPMTVTNFINLARDGFYDGLTFHRIIDGFSDPGWRSSGTDGRLRYNDKGRSFRKMA